MLYILNLCIVFVLLMDFFVSSIYCCIISRLESNQIRQEINILNKQDATSHRRGQLLWLSFYVIVMKVILLPLWEQLGNLFYQWDMGGLARVSRLYFSLSECEWMSITDDGHRNLFFKIYIENASGFANKARFSLTLHDAERKRGNALSHTLNNKLSIYFHCSLQLDLTMCEMAKSTC